MTIMTSDASGFIGLIAVTLSSGRPMKGCRVQNLNIGCRLPAVQRVDGG